MKQKEKRELLFRTIFSQGFQEDLTVEKDTIGYFTKNEKEISEEDKEEILREYEQLKLLLPEIDDRINKDVERWNTQTMAKVELSILRVMVYEMFYKKATPAKVLFNDAVHLALKYGQESSYRFVNGALAKLVNEKKENL